MTFEPGLMDFGGIRVVEVAPGTQIIWHGEIATVTDGQAVMRPGILYLTPKSYTLLKGRTGAISPTPAT